MPSFYIGSRADRIGIIEGVRVELKQAGWKSTYDWDQFFNGDAEKLKTVGNSERDGVLGADVVCISLPGGFGTHVELGLALARHRISGGRSLLVLHAENEADLDPYKSGKPVPFYYCDGVNILICPIDVLAKNLLMVYKQYSKRFEGVFTKRGV